MISLSTQLVVFRLGEQRYAVPLTGVERVISAVEVTLLPDAPSIVLGVINIAGDIVPVINLRRRLGLAEHDVRPADQFLIAQTARQTVALVIDEAQGVIELSGSEITAISPLVPGVDQLPGLIKLPDGMVLLHDLEKILSFEETQVLSGALQREVTRAP